MSVSEIALPAQRASRSRQMSSPRTRELLEVTTESNHPTSNEQLDDFGKDFFESESMKRKPDQYFRYDLETIYPGLERDAVLLRSYFNPAKVLDVGCAKGFLVLAFRKMGIETWGVDISDYALSKAPREVQAYLAKVDLYRDTLPFQDAEFDLVTAIGVLEYAWNLPHALGEFRRVLRPQGVLYIRVSYGHWTRKPDAPMLPQDANSWIREVEQHGFSYLGKLSKRFYRDQLKASVRASRSIQARAATKLLFHPILWSLLGISLNVRKVRGRFLFRAQQ